MESKRIIEALVVGGVLVVSMANQVAMAASSACNNGTASAIAAGTFVVTGFTPKCSANVHVDLAQVNQTLATVKGMSTKGMHSFGGSTAGGAVSACETTSAAFGAPTAGTSTGCS